MLGQQRVGLVVACLDTLQVQDRDATQASQLAREPDVHHGVHGGGEHRDAQAQTREVDGGIDLGRLDRLHAGRQRDIVKAIGPPDAIEPRSATWSGCDVLLKLLRSPARSIAPPSTGAARRWRVTGRARTPRSSEYTGVTVASRSAQPRHRPPLPDWSTSTTSAPPPPTTLGHHGAHAAAAIRSTHRGPSPGPSAGVAEAGDAAAHRCLQAPGRVQRAGLPDPRRASSGCRRPLVRQPRPGRGTSSTHPGHPGRGRDALGRARPSRWPGCAPTVPRSSASGPPATNGSGSPRRSPASRAWCSSPPMTTRGSSPARAPAAWRSWSSSRSWATAPDAVHGAGAHRGWRTGVRCRDGRQVAPTRCPRVRRGAGGSRGCGGVAARGSHRALGRRAGRPDRGGRDAHLGARRAHLPSTCRGMPTAS